MKKFLFMGAIAAMLLGTASCSSDMEPEMTDGTVQFKVELPGAIESRAISDGLTANKLAVAVYDSEGKELTDLSLTGTKVVTMSDKTATVSFKLVKGQTYSFAFWAQANGAPYTFDTASKTINVDYGEGKVDCNNESRDAFYAYKTYEVTGPVNETIKLTRPFAQLNFGADDLAAAAKAGITPSQSQVVVSKVGTAFNLATGKTEGEQENVTFKLAAIPSDQLKVQDKTYGWMAMNYFLAPGDDAIISATMTVKTNKADVVVPATNVPVKKNHRTNIVGSLFTEDANFNIIIDQRFDQPDLAPEKVWDGTLTEPADITGNVIEIKDGSELAWVMNSITNGTALAGKTFKLTDNINLGKKDWPLVNVKCSFTLDGNNKTIKGLKSTGGNYGGLIGKANNNVVIKNLTIKDSEIDAAGRTDDENAAGTFIGWCENHTSTAINLENCKSENVKIGRAQYNGGLVGYSSRINISNCIVLSAEVISDYAENGNYKGHTGCMVGFGNFDTAITNTSVVDTQITGRNDRGRVGIFYGTAQASVTIGTGNSVKNVTILGNAATASNLVGSVDNREDKSNDNTVTFE